jgi:cytochrome P450
MKFMPLPVGPKTPATLQMLSWVFKPMPYMEECAKAYGDIFTLKLQKNLPPLVFIHSPEAMQQVLSNDTKELEAPGELNNIFEYLLGKSSVILLSGAQHQRQRQLMMPPLHGERMRNYADVINDLTEKTINKQPLNQPFNVRTATQDITLSVMMQAVFGLHEGERAEKLQHLLCEILEVGSAVWIVALLYFPALKNVIGISQLWEMQQRKQDKSDQLIYEEIREQRENPDPSRTDILSLLMAARDEAGQPMTDVELRDELMTLLVAGHETTATAIAWALYWIHTLPEVKQKLLHELDSLGENPDSNAIFKLPYLTAVCNETLRIYPIGMLTFPRRVKTPTVLCGHELETGTVIMGSIYLTHNRADIYPHPKQFNPERFLEKQFSPYEFLPFGAGARRCIGLAFAQFEMKLVLAKILSGWELELADTRDIKPKRRGLVTGPDRPIQMVVKSKRQVKSRTLETSAV